MVILAELVHHQRPDKFVIRKVMYLMMILAELVNYKCLEGADDELSYMYIFFLNHTKHFVVFFPKYYIYIYLSEPFTEQSIWIQTLKYFLILWIVICHNLDNKM